MGELVGRNNDSEKNKTLFKLKKKKNSKYEISNLATPKSPYMGNLTGFD